MNHRSVRLVALGAAATLALSAGAVTTAQDKQVITMIAAQYTDAMQPYFDQLAASFEEANPAYDVQVQVVSWNDIDQKVTTLVQTGQMPDIANLIYFASFAADDLLYTAEEIVSAEVLADIIPAFMENSKYEGTAYAVPDLASDRLFFSNPDLLAAAGVEKVPATWSELKAACEAIKATTPDVIPLAMPLGPEEAQAEFFIWAGGNGGGYFKDGTWVVNSPENVEALTFLKELVDMGCTQSSPATTDRTAGAWPLFYEGKAAMTNGAIFLPSVMETAGASVPYTVSPFIANDGKESVTLGVQDYFFGFKKDGNQAGIQAFLTYLFQADNYAAFLTAAGGFLPATLSAAPIVAADPEMKPFVDVLPTAVFYPSDQANWPEVQGAIQTSIGTAVLQGADPQAVLDQIQAIATGG